MNAIAVANSATHFANAGLTPDSSRIAAANTGATTRNAASESLPLSHPGAHTRSPKSLTTMSTAAPSTAGWAAAGTEERAFTWRV